MNPHIDQLHSYPFEKLAALKQDIQPPPELAAVALSIGEPQHAAPDFVLAELQAQLSQLSRYPSTRGLAQLRQTIAEWLQQRFSLPAGSVDPERQVLPVNGTREALFAIAQATVDAAARPLVMMPNPFYQIYEGAALLSGAEPYYLNTTAQTDFLPDLHSVPEALWRRCQLIYICSPGNPTGRVMPLSQLQWLIDMAERYDFVIAADECYSEIYLDEQAPPVGLLQAAAAMGNDRFARCVVFHSLSKRSNLPGLRSGFVAGDAAILASFFKYRTYHGCAMPLHHQYASIAAWSDEAHVSRNREAYRHKFDAVLAILGEALDVRRPEAGFYLWPELAQDDTVFARELFASRNVTVLPGQYLSREAHGENPGARRVRMALVAEPEQCVEAARRIADFLAD